MSTATDPLSRTFAALADPTRRAILTRLRSGTASVSELAEPFDMSRPAVSQHLKVLREAGLIEQVVDAQRRPCVLLPAALDDAQEWVAAHTAAWQERFDRLDDRLADLQPERTPES